MEMEGGNGNGLEQEECLLTINEGMSVGRYNTLCSRVALPREEEQEQEEEQERRRRIRRHKIRQDTSSGLQKLVECVESHCEEECETAQHCH
jgi:hypothetical protein